MAVIDLSTYTVTLNKTLMAENKISVTISSPTARTFTILDTYTLDGEVYKLNRPPKETKGGKDTFTYNLVLEAQQYELNRKIFLLDGNREFTIVGDLEFFVDLIVTNISEIDSGWTKGDIVSTSDKNLTFTSEDCRSVLGKLADEFDVEFKIDAKVITFADQVGQATGLTFQYGLDNGLYQLSRQNVDSKNTVTRVYGFGSSQNLPNDYRSVFNQLVFEAKFLEDTSEYPDIVEGEVTFEDIKPSFEGAITTVTGANNVTISVTSMDFDLEAQLNAGVTAKVVFNSGDLLGQQFEILDNSYVDLTKTFTLIATEDATGTTYPNATFKPLVGDLITFVDIHMPASYITAAETELQTATQTYLDQNKKFRVTYNLTFDNRHTDAQSLDIGDTVILIDTDFNVNRTIRITSISKKFDGDKLQLFTGKISDYVPVNLEQRLIAKTINSEKTIIVNNSVSKDDSRRNTLKNRKLNDLVFDPDGFFDTDNIRPLSINTLFLSVGAKSQNFKLATSVIEANYLADENRMVVSAGTLYHREVEGDAGFVWTLSAFDQSSLVAGTDYFAYVKCSKTASTGVFFLSTSQLAADPDDGFFYFWLGILYAVVDNTRDFDLTNGMTYINGRTITTGRVQSLNGLNYLDLDLNKFALGDGTNGIDWNVTASNTLTLIGALVQSGGGTTAGIGVFLGAYSGATTYYIDDEVTNAGSLWRYINATPSAGNTPAEDAFWTEVAAKGDTGSGGTDARAVSITTDVQGFTYDTNGANPSPSTSTITATALNTTGTVYYDFLLNGVSDQNTTTPTYTYTPQALYSNMPDEIQIDIREGADTGTILASDVMAMVGLKSGTDALTLVLSNEAHTLPADTNGVVSSYSDSGTTIRLYEGATELIYDTVGTADSTWKVTATPTNITTGSIVDSGNFATVGDHSAMTSDEASISYLIEGKRSTGVAISLTKIQSFSKSIQGDSGIVVSLTSVDQGFDYDTNGANPSPASTTVTATALNLSGTIYYDFLLNDVSDQNTTSNTYTYTPQALYASMPDKIEVNIRSAAPTGTILASDQMTMLGLKAGENAITIILSNEAHTLPTTNSGVVTYTGSGTTIEVWEGTTQLTIDQNVAYANSTFRVTAGVEFVGDFDNVDFDDFDDGLFFVTPITNITVGSQTGADGSNTITYGDASMMNADSAYIPFNITVKNSAGVEFNFNRIQSFAKSIEGADGGGTGDVGASAVFQGVWDNTVDYFGDGVRVDIVQYAGVYYVARTDPPASPFSGIVPTNTSYWNTFGATFESVATDLLFASLAYIENLGVKYLRTDVTGQRIFIDGSTNEMTFFNSSDEEVLKLSNAGMVANMVDSIFKSTNTGVGDLDGSVVNTQANVTGLPEIFSAEITGSSGDADVACNGTTRSMVWMVSTTVTIDTFISTHGAAFVSAGCTLTRSGVELIFTSLAGIAFTSDPTITNTSGDLDGTPAQTQAPTSSVKRIDTVTLTGTGGIANVLCDGNTEQANWAGSLTQSASDFAFLHAAGYLSGGVVVTSSGDDIIFTADVAGVDFTGSTTISNTPNANLGSVKIDGNQLWENDQNSDTNSLIFINEKGYLGGKTKYRSLGIGNGRGELMMLFEGNTNKTTSISSILVIDGVEFRLDNIPTSGAGLFAGEVYRDSASPDANLKIK